MDSCKNKGFLYQEVCNNQPHPFSYWFKGCLNSSWGKGLLLHTSSPSSVCCFPHKAPTSHLLIYVLSRRDQCKFGLGNKITQERRTPVLFQSYFRASSGKPWNSVLFIVGNGKKIIPFCLQALNQSALQGTLLNFIRSDQSLSRVLLFATPWIAARQASLSITNSWSSPRLTFIESVMSSSHLILCRPLLLLPLDRKSVV